MKDDFSERFDETHDMVEFWDEDENYDAIKDCFADIVSGSDFEPIVYDLLRNHGPGEWATIRDLFDHAGIPRETLFEYHATLRSKKNMVEMPVSWVFCWLTEPSGLTDFVVIFLFDRMTMASNVAVYNRDHLFGIYGHS